MTENVRSKIPLAIVLIIIVCLILNHNIKKDAFMDAINADTVKAMMVGTCVDSQYNEYYSGYVICTKDNIESITIKDKYVHLGLFEQYVLVDFDIVIVTDDTQIGSEGYIRIKYKKNDPYKWEWENRGLDGDIVIYGKY